MQVSGDFLEAPVAVAGVLAGSEAVHGLSHGLDILLQVDPRAVVEEAAPLRIEPHEVEIIGEVAAGFREDALQHPRHGEDRRAHVEAEAVLVQNRRLAADPGILVVEGDLVSAGRRDTGRRQSAQSSADDRNRSPLSVHVSSRKARTYPHGPHPIVLVLGRARASSRRITKVWAAGADHAKREHARRIEAAKRGLQRGRWLLGRTIDPTVVSSDNPFIGPLRRAVRRPVPARRGPLCGARDPPAAGVS